MPGKWPGKQPPNQMSQGRKSPSQERKSLIPIRNNEVENQQCRREVTILYWEVIRERFRVSVTVGKGSHVN